MAAPKESAAKAAKVEPTAPKAAKVDDSHLVEMTKGGETLLVHPSCVVAHQRAGWSGA